MYMQLRSFELTSLFFMPLLFWEFQCSPRRFFNARNLTTRSAGMLTSLIMKDICATLLNEIKSVLDENILKLSDNKLINLLLYHDPQFDSNKNTRLLNAAIKYIKDSGRFTVHLL